MVFKYWKSVKNFDKQIIYVLQTFMLCYIFSLFSFFIFGGNSTKTGSNRLKNFLHKIEMDEFQTWKLKK